MVASPHSQYLLQPPDYSDDAFAAYLLSTDGVLYLYPLLLLQSSWGVNPQNICTTYDENLQSSLVATSVRLVHCPRITETLVFSVLSRYFFISLTAIAHHYY